MNLKDLDIDVLFSPRLEGFEQKQFIKYEGQDSI